MLVACKQCGIERDLIDPRKNRTNLCKDCADTNRKKIYRRVCIDCGDVKIVGNNKAAKSERCRSCASRINSTGRFKGTERIIAKNKKYKVFCPMCEETRFTTTQPKNRKSDMCSNCSRRYSKKPKDKDGNIMRFFRICCICNDIKEVRSAKNAEVKYCRKHAIRPTGIKRKQVAGYKKAKTAISQAAIEKVRKINKEHKAIQDEIKKKPIPRAKLSDKDMVKVYLRKNKVNNISSKEPKFLGHTMHNSGSKG